MGKIIFFTGGARSGKSKFAEEYIKEKKYEKNMEMSYFFCTFATTN